MKISTLLVGAFGGIVLFTIVLPAILMVVLVGDVMAAGVGGAAWLFSMRLTGKLILFTISGDW